MPFITDKNQSHIFNAFDTFIAHPLQKFMFLFYRLLREIAMLAPYSICIQFSCKSH